MEKISIILFVVLFSATNVIGQKTELDISILPTVTSIRGNDFTDEFYNPAFNFSGGVGLNHFIGTNSLISTSLRFDKKGGTHSSHLLYEDPVTQNQLDGTIKIRSNYNYLTLAAEYRKRFGNKIQCEFGIGFYFGYLIKQVDKAEFAGMKESTVYTDDFKRLDVGLSASWRVYVPLNEKISFVTGLNDQLGLLNIATRHVINDGSIKLNSLGLVLGLSFKI